MDQDTLQTIQGYAPTTKKTSNTELEVASF